MKTHRVPKIAAKPDWDKIPAVAIDSRHWTPPVDIAARAKICYDEEALYLCLSAREEEIRSEHTGPLGMPCEDSCLEFFFSPVYGDNRYFNIEFNPNGCLYLGMGSGVEDLVRLLPEGPDLFGAVPKRTEDGWEISYRVPASFVRRFFPAFSLAPGNRIQANFYKCGDLTPQEHYFSWNPMTSETPAFHRPCDFGLLILEE